MSSRGLALVLFLYGIAQTDFVARTWQKEDPGVVVLDEAWGWAALGPGVDLDLGAIAKGDGADRACAVLAEAGLDPPALRTRRCRSRWGC